MQLHASRLGNLDSAAKEDVAAEKSLDLWRRIDSGRWKPEGETPTQVRALVSTVARNGVVDVLRHAGRHRSTDAPGEVESRRSVDSSEERIQQREFAEALRECVGHLEPRRRTAWFLRVFFEFPSKVIARHADVDLSPAHVDVLLQRTRENVSACMTAKGLRLSQLPPGTFAALWDMMKPGTISTEVTSD